MRATNGQPGRGEASRTSLGDGAMSAAREEGVNATFCEPADDIGPDLRWKMSEYFQEGRGVMDTGRFTAMAVDGNYLVT